MNLLRRIRFCACALHLTFPPASNLRDIADITLLKRQIRRPSGPNRAKDPSPPEGQTGARTQGKPTAGTQEPRKPEGGKRQGARAQSCPQQEIADGRALAVDAIKPLPRHIISAHLIYPTAQTAHQSSARKMVRELGRKREMLGE